VRHVVSPFMDAGSLMLCCVGVLGTRLDYVVSVDIAVRALFINPDRGPYV
jgi:hypothetical protein